MAFIVKKKVELKHIAPEWAGCFMEFSDPSIAEIENYVAELQAEQDNGKSNVIINKFLADHFLAGKGHNGTEIVAINKEDIPTLPSAVITEAIQFISNKDMEAADPKGQESLKPPSSTAETNQPS